MRASASCISGLLAAFWLSTTSPASAECRLGMAAAMPLRSVGTHFVVTTKINDHSSDLVLDTGAFATTITMASASRLGLRPDRYPGEAVGIGGYQDLYSAKVASMRIGRMSADGVTVAIEKMGIFADKTALDGLFGMNMMSHYDIDLDIIGHQAVLFQAEGGCSKPTVSLGPDLYVVPLTDVHRDQEAIVPVVVEGHRLRALLDTGAGSTVIFRNTALRLGVDLSGLRADDRHVGGGIGDSSVAVMKHVFKTVDIGDLRFENMPIWILAQHDLGIDRHHIGSRIEQDDNDDPGGEDMLLGADFMQKVHLWISHSSHTLVMQFPPKASPPLPKG